MDTLAERYEQVLERMTQAAQRAGRNPADITLVAVTKTWPAETAVAAYAAGMRHFGENRPEELAQKRTIVTASLPHTVEKDPDHAITWHLIGTLQSRKTDLAAAHADVFHALDRAKIASRLSTQVRTYNHQLPLFLEVNISGEMSKSGFIAHNWENDATQQEALRTIVQTIMKMPHIPLIGLMTMAPWNVPEDEIRAVFRRTRELAMWLETAVPGITLPYLSMGMTDDFEIAIEEGATHIRVGRAIFGSR